MLGFDEGGGRQMLGPWGVDAAGFWLGHDQTVTGLLRGSSILRGVKTLNDEDVTEIERAGRRCSVCRTGRHWRDFTVVRPDGGEPVVMCAACRARYGDAVPGRPAQEKPAPAPAPAPRPDSSKPKQRSPQGEDRLRRVLRELPKGEHTTGSIAKAARLNHAKTLRRLRQLAESGEIRQVGERWSTEPPPSDLDAAFERLQARTSNIRIVRDRSPVG